MPAWQTVKCPGSGSPTDDEVLLEDHPFPNVYECSRCGAHVMAESGVLTLHYREPPLDDPANPVGD